MKTYIRVLKLLLPYKFTFAIALLCMFLFALSTGAMAYLIGPVMQFLFNPGGGESIKIIPFDLYTIPTDKMLLAIPLAIIIVAAVKGLSSFGQTYFMGYVGLGVVRDIRKNLYEHVLKMPVEFFSSTPTGVLVSRLTNDVNLLQMSTSDTLTTLLKQGLTLIVLAVVLVALDWKLSLAALVALPLSFYPMRRFGKKMKRVSTRGQEIMGSMMALLNEAIKGIRIVKAFCMQDYESERFGHENDEFTRYRLKSIKVRSISSPLMETVGAVGFALTIWYAAFRIGNGTLKPEAFISFFAAVIMFYQPVKSLNGANLNIQNGLAAAKRIFDLLDRETEKEDGTVEIDGVKESVEFKDVSFSYGGERVLDGIDLKVNKGEVVAIVGSSGAGKTTFVNLLPRFYDVEEGAILIDGRDIRDFTLKSLRSQIAIVSQQIVLFNDTVRGNIAYGDRTRTEEEIISAAKAANAHGFIKRLPKGYDTFIGESGVRLSGGERQRLSIARAILKNSPLLILDEATSSLDTESEMEVQEGLENLMEGKTTFVIAHRLSTVRNAGRIIVLSRGRIKEMGRHEDLLESGGEYSRLYSMQFR
ncbi:MAG: lipid A export permease/ATP-binding protein MsbA [Thermodesulfobacteriota bacterium]|nr:MAG: lipid A export permease/ATP-binding protein MsbA [Thermodesulfobacteriota bacterium]